MKQVFLVGKYKDRFAQISDLDFDRVSQHRWMLCRIKQIEYARAKIAGKSVFMHVFIMGKVDGREIDHSDGDGLNNTRENLNFVTHSDNMRNTYFHRVDAEWRRSKAPDWTEAIKKF